MTALFTLLLRHQIYVYSISMVASHIQSIRQVLLTLPSNYNPVQPFFTTCCYLQSVLPLYLILCAACVRPKSLQSCSTLRPYGLYPTRLLCLWDSPGPNTVAGCHALLQGIFPTQGWTPHLLGPLHCRPGGSDGKESACNGGDPASSSWSGKSPGEGQPTPVFLPGESHGQRSLAGCSPYGHKESVMTEAT